MHANLTIEAAQTAVHQWITATEKGYFAELTNLGILMEEVGEVSRILVRKYGEQSAKTGEPPADLADEMADVLWVLLALANQTGVNLAEAFVQNLEKKNTRDKGRHT